jgi:hypothetical protein
MILVIAGGYAVHAEKFSRQVKTGYLHLAVGIDREGFKKSGSDDIYSAEWLICVIDGFSGMDGFSGHFITRTVAGGTQQLFVARHARMAISGVVVMQHN